jgi:hypothetical protein
MVISSTYLIPGGNNKMKAFLLGCVISFLPFAAHADRPMLNCNMDTQSVAGNYLPSFSVEVGTDLSGDFTVGGIKYYYYGQPEGTAGYALASSDNSGGPAGAHYVCTLSPN